MNMRKMSVLPVLLLTAVLVMLVSACTRKDNLTGDNWSELTPMIAMDSTFYTGYSYTHAGKVKGTETSLVCGTDAAIDAISVMRFSGLADTIIVLQQPVLKLVATRRSPLNSNPLALSFHKLNANWAADSTDVISDVDIFSLSIPYFTVQDTISTSGDTLSINIPNEIIENWKTEGVTGLNLVIKTIGERGHWMEFKSTESGNGPLLTFKYRIPGSTDTLSYSQRAIRDSYRVTGTQTEVTETTLILKNLLPQRIMIKNGLPLSIFKDKDGIVLSDLDRKRMTINKAELVLFIKENPYYVNTRCNFFPYRVKPDTLINNIVLTDSDLEIITHTYNSTSVIDADSVKIDITALTQAFTSGDVENNGIVIKNTSEMQNFGNLEFWHYANAPAGKRPYVKIYYTVPYLKGN
jgi:hypothetical protein